MATTINHAEIARTLEGRVSVAVECWFRECCETPYVPFYLYYRLAGGDEVVGGIQISAAPPGAGWVLGRAERILPSWSREKAAHFVREAVQKLPLLNGCQ